MFPLETKLQIGQDHPGRDALFESVDRFAFVGRGKAGLLVQSVSIGTVTLAIVQSSGHDIALNDPENATFLAPLQGRVGVETSGTSVTADRHGALFLRPGYRSTAVRPNRSGVFRAAVALTSGRALGRARDPSRQACLSYPAVSDSAAGALHEFLIYFVDQFSRPCSPLRRPVAQHAAAAFVSDLFAALDGSDASDVARANRLSASRVRSAQEFMRAGSDQPLTIVEVADAVGVGPRVLQAAFQRHVGMSPREALTAMRLDRARERLLSADPMMTVTDAAELSGFAHLGRFALAYRQRFGESPSETRRRRPS